ncbi:MAG: sensor histidine kinase [Methyloligellaceae bacterium]
MKLNSLAFRLFASAAVWMLIVIPITAFTLISLYRHDVEKSFDARLSVYLTTLVADVAASPSGPISAANLGDPAFSLPFSGWYWQIAAMGGSSAPITTSSSLLDQALVVPSALGVKPDKNNIRKAYVPGPENQRLRVIEREIALDAGEGRARFSFAVAGDASEMDAAVTQFTTLLLAALALLGGGLLAATWIQVQFGLRPLRAIRRSLADIRNGKAEQLEGDLPAEIVPLQDDLNALIQANRAIVERSRMHVGNLAHALKTPLSVITNEARGKRSALARIVADQAEVMGNQINHHLDRARMAARAEVATGSFEVEPVLAALVRVLQKIYSEKGISISLSCPADIKFLGEKHDFEEMIGNLADNACKWAKSEVSLKVVRRNPGAGRSRKRLVIFVDDDGPGLTRKKREEALKRGHRLDETKPGSGLGLSIVSELARVYRGTFKLKESPLGGLRARLQLPAAYE